MQRGFYEFPKYNLLITLVSVCKLNVEDHGESYWSVIRASNEFELSGRRRKSTRFVEEYRCFSYLSKTVEGKAKVHILRWTTLCNRLATLWAYTARHPEGYLAWADT